MLPHIALCHLLVLGYPRIVGVVSATHYLMILVTIVHADVGAAV